MSDKKLGCLIPLGVVVVLLIVVAICSFRAEPYAPSTAPQCAAHVASLDTTMVHFCIGCNCYAKTYCHLQSACK